MQNHWEEDWSKLDSVSIITRLRQIAILTFLIMGSEDGEDIKMIVKAYKQRVTDTMEIVIDDAAHLLNVKNPTQFDRDLKKILIEKLAIFTYN